MKGDFHINSGRVWVLTTPRHNRVKYYNVYLFLDHLTLQVLLRLLCVCNEESSFFKNKPTNLFFKCRHLHNATINQPNKQDVNKLVCHLLLKNVSPNPNQTNKNKLFLKSLLPFIPYSQAIQLYSSHRQIGGFQVPKTFQIEVL